MRGKMKAVTRFNKFKTDMLAVFRDDDSIMSDFIAFLREMDESQLKIAIHLSCDESENLLFLQSSGPTTIYQVIRLVNRPILLRDLEVLSELIWGDAEGKKALYTAISILCSINLVDYSLRDFNSTPSNVVQLFVKEEE